MQTRSYHTIAAQMACCVVAFFISGCVNTEQRETITLFTPLPPDSTGVTFTNQLHFDQQFNIYTYRNFYNGGGVGLGDINNDGLVDIYLTANLNTNKLYLNKGNLKFEDITEAAGVGGTKAWSTGVAMADVNGDGWLDIYVCNSGDVEGDDKENELFINNGDNTFTERAKEYGLADKGFTTHAVFFDYDLDGDLDVYILNNSYQAIGSFNLRKNERPKRDALGGDKLMRNDGNKFVDVSEQAGIYGSVIGFGLGVTVGDINKDGWPDLYVSNDFFERDYLYINNQDGTFRECLTEQMKSISGASMGADLADINNDTWPDIFVTEMLPEPNERIKTVTTFENWDRYQNNVINDYYHQFTRNMLQLNNANNTFSEVGRLAGVEATDWSWGALMFDADNDGLKDIFVANGIYQDLTNQDYLQYVSSEEVVKAIVSNNRVDYKKLVELIPSNPVPDYFFQNQGGLKFVNKASEWGLGEPNFSNGSAYGDLDNDGDLDLVINRVNEPAIIARNNTSTLLPDAHYLKFKLTGSGKNTLALGSTIEVQADGNTYFIEQMPNRGFQSSVDPRPHLGLGKSAVAERVLVRWPGGKQTALTRVPTNQVIELSEEGASQKPVEHTAPQNNFLFMPAEQPLLHRHIESEFVDFDRDKLCYHMQSNEGPRLAVADVNGDALPDVLIGGARDQPARLHLQQPNGIFTTGADQPWFADRLSEDMGIEFFDADGDGDVDVYVCSGSSEFSNVSNALMDRLYINDGRGNFVRSNQTLPTPRLENSSCVRAADFDRDGDIDLFVGVRGEAFRYGRPVSSYVLVNNGKGAFTDVTKSVAPGLANIGMVTDARWADVDNDGDVDLMVVGEFMPIKIFLNSGGKLTETVTPATDFSAGWWNRIEAADLDGDGDIDFVLANHGLNSRFRASREKPITMYVNDFDRNGSTEQILCVFNGDISYPVALRHDLVAQIPSLKKKYLKYDSYKNQTIHDIFSPAELEGATRLEAFQLASVVLWNEGDGRFSLEPLPLPAQLSVMYAIAVFDINNDGHLDIITGGNQYRAKPEVGRYDASYGAVLLGDGKRHFASVPPTTSGLVLHGEVRDFGLLNIAGKPHLVVLRNNDTALTYKVTQP
jgi:hypothetical protein